MSSHVVCSNAWVPLMLTKKKKKKKKKNFFKWKENVHTFTF